MVTRKADVLVKGGLMVTGQGITRSDLLVQEGKVAEVGADLSARPAARVIDATGKYVLPGGVDAHAHPVFSDKIDKMSVCAAYGGVTTLVCFIGNVPAWGLSGNTVDLVKQFIEEAERTSVLDVAVHGILTPADADHIPTTVPQLIRMGIPSFKMFMAYTSRGLRMPDETLVQIMDLAARDGGLAQVHAETGACIDYLEGRFVAQGKTGPEWFAPSQPNILEVEALTRAATFSAVTGCPLYPVHLSTREVPAVLRHFHEVDKAPLYGETCPQYLTLTNREVLTKGPIGKVGPPLREPEDNDAMWQAVANGTIDVIGSDSTGLSSGQKFGSETAPGKAGGDIRQFNIFQASYGGNTLEHMMPVVWTHGVNAGRITLPRLVQVLCENPAKIFGLYPQKGALQQGSDADLVVWDPAKAHTVKGQHGNADFSSFEGFELLGMPVLTMQRGEAVMESDRIVRSQGRARFLPGDPNRAAYAQKGHKVR